MKKDKESNVFIFLLICITLTIIYNTDKLIVTILSYFLLFLFVFLFIFILIQDNKTSKLKILIIENKKDRTIDKPKGFRSPYPINPDSLLFDIWNTDCIDALVVALYAELDAKARLCQVVKKNTTHNVNQLIHRIINRAFLSAFELMIHIQNIHIYDQKLNYIMNKTSSEIKKEMDKELKIKKKAES